MSENDLDRVMKQREQGLGFNFETRGVRQGANVTWFRGEQTNYNPTKQNFVDPTAVEHFILKGWIPTAPFVSKETRITAFGSCFAAHIGNYLNDNGYNVLTKGSKVSNAAYVIRCGEGIVNTFALLQQFEWAFEGKSFTQNLWHGYDAEEHGYDEIVRQHTLEIFKSTDLFIITVGLSEVWHDKQSGEVFWRAIPIDKFDSTRHGFKVSSHAENRANINRIVEIIRKHRPEAHILFTLSPIPLVATFRPLGCLSANSVSKAILRAAIDEVLRDHEGDPNIHYFPSYEIVTELFLDRFDPDRRHVKKEIIDFVMSTFEYFFCSGDIDRRFVNYFTRMGAALRNDGQAVAAANALRIVNSYARAQAAT